MNEQWMSWLLQGGSVAIPKRLLVMADVQGLTLEDLGALLYLFYLEEEVKPRDTLGQAALKRLYSRGLVQWDEKTGQFQFTPLIKRLFESSQQEDRDQRPLSKRMAMVIRQLERQDGRFLSEYEKKVLAKILNRYCWDDALIMEIFRFYFKHRSERHYTLQTFVHMAEEADVKTLDDFRVFSEKLDWPIQKVKAVLLRLGKYNYPTPEQMNYYHKWTHMWQFSHDMVILAADNTINANNPSIGYVDKVLENWKECNLFTKEAVLMHQKNKSAERSREVIFKDKKITNRAFKDASVRDLNQLEE